MDIIPKETEQFSAKDLRMEKSGATRELAYRTIVEACTAETMTLDKFGDEHFAPDHSTRVRAAEMIAKMRGDIRPEVVVDNRQVTVTGVPSDVVAALVELARDVASQLKALSTSGRQTGEIIDV